MARRTRLLTPPELAVEVSAWLAGAGIQHAIGGAIAFGFHAEPRGTLDVDMNVFVAADAPEVALQALADHGVRVDFAEASRAIASRGDLFLEHRGCRLDLFFNSIPFQEAASRRTREVVLLGRRVPILSAEDLVVLKLLFNRHKDIVDIERLLETSAQGLDADYIRRWLIECVGVDDSRVATWDSLLES
ncbi:MAG: hypothetical protein OXH52_17310 [Gammaproteobacteria bacterium]|nr:hypothetical protein [Gammaproteobacteria bacterium]